MAFTYTTDWTDREGKRQSTGGTWNAASVTSGTISFGPIAGQSIGAIVRGMAYTSVSATTMVASKVVPGGATTQSTIAITCVSGDKGYWEASWL